MNRRGFLDSILKAGVGAMILPSAVTYARAWKRSRYLWYIDWQDVKIGVGINQRLVDTAYDCIIVPPEPIVLHAEKYEAKISGWILENFSIV